MFKVEPIVNIISNEVIGYEILFNGSIPNDVLFKEPSVYIDLFIFDKIKQFFFDKFSKIKKKIFININIETLCANSNLFSELPGNVYFEVIENGRKFNFYENCLCNEKDKIIIDDFGTGNANIDTIIRLKPFGVKLDRIILNFSDTFLINLLSELNKHCQIVIFEKIETQEELERIKSLGFQFAQGYIFSKLKHYEFLFKIPQKLSVKSIF
ncbi:EAL domain-containing protein [Deferribacter autotrophicus]|uniref:EAL domain-containing protein n=1 Tax=Deferribacter autotrophicus TaxID=500465 RepID=A0A5A8F1G8_9BACT|nr:EAL domain-containing protein [Deferribacter autotrophicus]KAA0257532.1 EAL domain-containing protein [Deferribacter autotrophicus]